MKKSLFASVFAVLVSASGVCLATVPNSAVSIAGVTPGMSVEAARSALGNPSFDGHKMVAANGAVVKIDKHRNIVEEIEVEYGTAATAAGIHIGSGESALNAYGTADKVEHKHGKVEYTYFSADYSMKMEFKVVNGVVAEMQCELR